MNKPRELQDFIETRRRLTSPRLGPRRLTSAPGCVEPVRGHRRTRVPTLSCVIPCWNEARNLALLLPLLRDLLPSITDVWEIVLVDDGSTDDTAAVMGQWADVPGFRVLLLSRNFGKQAALTAGLEAAAGEVVVMMDADLQHPPSLIPSMIEHWQQGADVVYAVRANRSGETLFKRVGARMFYGLINRSDGFDVPANAGDFRLLDRGAVDALLSLPERNRFMSGLYAWIGFNAAALPYVPKARAHGRTSFSIGRLLQVTLDGITAFTTWPLRLASAAGVAMALAGFTYGAYLTVEYLLYGNHVSGWTTIVVSMLFFMGVQLICLGIMGEYVARIFTEVKGRPLYIVKRDLGQGLAARHL